MSVRSMTTRQIRARLRLAAAALAIGGAVLAAQQPQTQPSPQQPQRPRERVSEDGGRLEKVGPTMSRVVPDNTPYDQWIAQARSRIPMFSGLVIDDARTTPLKPWAEMGVDGMYIRMADYQIIDGFVLEI